MSSVSALHIFTTRLKRLHCLLGNPRHWQQRQLCSSWQVQLEFYFCITILRPLCPTHDIRITWDERVATKVAVDPWHGNAHLRHWLIDLLSLLCAITKARTAKAHRISFVIVQFHVQLHSLFSVLKICTGKNAIGVLCSFFKAFFRQSCQHPNWPIYQVSR